MPDDLLRMLEEMDKSADRAPWTVAFGCNVMCPRDDYASVSAFSATSNRYPDWQERNETNAHAATALRNSLPALLDVLRAADAVMDECGQVGSPSLGTAERYHVARARFAQAIKEGKE